MNYLVLFTKQVKVSKSKKAKKPKFKTNFLSASEIRNYVHTKFDIDNDEFWNWFFSKCQFGETNLLNFDDDDADIIHNTLPSNCREYYNILKNDFIPNVDEECCIEIKNDL